MIKLKDNITLEDLRKFRGEHEYSYGYHVDNRTGESRSHFTYYRIDDDSDPVFEIDLKTKKINKIAIDGLPILYDLIQAGLVEKEEDKQND